MLTPNSHPSCLILTLSLTSASEVDYPRDQSLFNVESLILGLILRFHLNGSLQVRPDWLTIVNLANAAENHLEEEARKSHNDSSGKLLERANSNVVRVSSSCLCFRGG